MRALNQPVSWWGWHWEPPVPMSVIELIQAGNMSSRLAALFWIGMERGASIIVAADPPSSGKTTTLSGLLAFTPPDTAVYFTRGDGETFALPPLSPAYPTYILINEISDHIPVYTWDDNARRAFDLLPQGYRIASTMHADSVQGVVSQLRNDLQIPDSEVAQISFIVPIYIGRREGVIRRVREVSLSRAQTPDAKPITIASWDSVNDSFDVLSGEEQYEAFAAWAGVLPPELQKQLDTRQGFLDRLQEEGAASLPEVNAAIEGFYNQTLKGN